MMRFSTDFGAKSALKPEQLENGKRRLSLLCFALLLLFRSRSLVALSFSCFTLVLLLRSVFLVPLSFSRSALVSCQASLVVAQVHTSDLCWLWSRSVLLLLASWFPFGFLAFSSLLV